MIRQQELRIIKPTIEAWKSNLNLSRHASCLDRQNDEFPYYEQNYAHTVFHWKATTYYITWFTCPQE